MTIRARARTGCRRARVQQSRSQNRKLIRSVPRDKTIEVSGEVEGPGPERNRTWYKTRDGFAYSAWLQKMEPYRTPKVYTNLGDWGIWIETIVANAPAYAEPDETSRLRYIYNYGTVFHATEAQVDAKGACGTTPSTNTPAKKTTSPRPITGCPPC